MTRFLLVLFIVAIGTFAKSQTTSNSGAFTTGSNWSGGTVPSGWTTINIGHAMTRSGNYSVQGTLNINAGGSLTLTGGNVTVTGGSTVNVYGTLNITGNVTLNSVLNIFPGGKVIIDGNVSVVSSTNLVVGTSAAAPPSAYSDLVITGNLTSTTSGDIRVRANGRVAVFGNVNDGGSGGTVLQIDNGGQTYIYGDLNFTNNNGNNNVNNDNTTTPYGLYINGNTNLGIGNSVDSNKGDQNTLQTTNPPFYSWVTSQPGYPGAPMPVKLLYFKVVEVSTDGVQLNWATSMEEDFDYFWLERAGTDLNFQAIATIKGNGGLDITASYDHLDEEPLYGKNYYRLKSVDLDQTSEYSDVIVAEWNFESQKSDVSVYPNPIVDRSFTLEIKHELTSDTRMTLLNSVGKEIIQQSITNSKQVISLQEDIKPGVYYLKISSSDFIKPIKVFIQ